MNLTFVIASLKAGGAERIMSGLANYLAQQGHQVSFITLADSTEDHYQLTPDINRVSINIYWQSRGRLDALLATFKRLRMIRRAVLATRPDAVLSFIDLTNIRVITAMLGSGIPVIISERVDPSVHEISKSWDLMRKKIYPYAMHVVVQTASAANWAKAFLPADKISVISNYIRKVTDHHDKPPLLGNRPTIIAAGRMVRQKGFDMLINAFEKSQLAQQGWQLVILGDGPERPVLESQILECGLENHILLPGVVTPVEAWFEHADIFVLSSRYEGFPNVLMEAMACGLPPIAFDCKSGPSEIIKNGINGILVPSEDTQAMAQALIYLANNPDKAMSLSIEAKKIINKYSARRITRTWIDLFQQVIARADMK